MNKNTIYEEEIVYEFETLTKTIKMDIENEKTLREKFEEKIFELLEHTSNQLFELCKDDNI